MQMQGIGEMCMSRLCMHAQICACDMHISILPYWGNSMGYSLHTKTNSSLKRKHKTAPPPWPQLFDQPPIPNRLPRSRFLSDLDRSSGKIYLPPLTNASITCESPSSRRRPLEIDLKTKSTSILFLCHPQTKSPLPKSILVRFGLGKWQNISTVPEERAGHLRNAVVASPPPRNRPQNEKYFDFVPLHPRTKLPPPKSILVRFQWWKQWNPPIIYKEEET
jgi:hypothetical protein